MSINRGMDKEDVGCVSVCVCVCVMEYYAAIKNEIMSFAATLMNLKMVIPSEVSQTEKDKYHMILFICEI